MRPLSLPLAILFSLLALSSNLLAEVAPNADRLTSGGEPQHATVTSPGAPVRSGPGDSYYLTDTLPEDTEVEVYKRQDDGWCAIRPPADSFSWVFAQHVQMVEGDLAEIAKDKVAARVGSRLGSQRDVVQVRMKQGERVQVLGRDDREGAAWVKIAPPAGEFRWIHARDIGLADGGLAGGGLEGAPRDAENRYAVRTVAVEQPVAGEEPVGGQGAGISAPPLATPESTATPQTLGNQWSPAKTAPPPTDVTPISPTAPTSAPPSTAELAAELQQLELRLSRMIAESPATWNIAPLEQSAEQLLARCDSIQDRSAVKSTLAKIDRFASIQRRYVGTNPIASAATTSTLGNPSPNAAMPNAIAPATATPIAGANANSPYDAVGTLRPVVSKRPGAPQFALVNAQGQVVTFITPTPDVNLQPFIGQQIGVTGSRGYIPEFRRAHVTAARVAPLNERMIR